MHIQWFPGHMTKSVRMMEENIKLCHGIIYVLDARAPFACVNSKLLKIFNNKPILYVLNKADLVDGSDLREVKASFIKESSRIISINGTVKKDAGLLYAETIKMLSPIIEKNAEKGVAKTLRVMVAGVPNTGKSTIINSLCGEKRAVTGDKAGVTRGKQWIKLKDIELLDTPGTMQPKLDNQLYARHLAYIGSINDNILDIETLCLEFIGEIMLSHPQELISRYSLGDINGCQPIEVFEEICRKRGFLFKKSEYDYERAARTIFDDFRKGRIGKICLEKNKCDETND